MIILAIADELLTYPLFTGRPRSAGELLAIQSCGMFTDDSVAKLLITNCTPQLFKQQGDFFDIPTSTLTPVQIREKLAALAGSVIGDAKVPAFKNALTLKSSPNGGVDVTDDLKYTSAYS